MSSPAQPATAEQLLTQMLNHEAADSGFTDPSFKLGYLISFAAQHATPAMRRDIEARIKLRSAQAPR